MDKTAAIIVGPRSATRHGDSSHAQDPIGGPLSIVCKVVVHVELRVLSLSVEEGRSTFGVMAEIWAKF